MAEIYLTNYCRIKDNSVKLNEEDIAFYTGIDFEAMAGNLYDYLELDYPKFYKMDNQSKLGLLASEVLLIGDNLLKKYEAFERGLILGNSDASFDTDENYLKTLNRNNYFPSPSLFVYTLANIVGGEICIRHKIKGENFFFISDGFDSPLFYFHIYNLLNHTDTKALIAGWINYNKSNYEAFLVAIETGNVSGQKFTLELLNELYNK